MRKEGHVGFEFSLVTVLIFFSKSKFFCNFGSSISYSRIIADYIGRRLNIDRAKIGPSVG